LGFRRYFTGMIPSTPPYLPVFQYNLENQTKRGITGMRNSKDFIGKLAILRRIISAKNADGVILNSQNQFSWLTGGRGFIGLASTAACASLVVTMDKVYLVSENIEARRLFREQLAEDPRIEVLEYSWYSPDARQRLLDDLPGLKTVLSEKDIEGELFEARTILSAEDMAEYEDICAAAAREVEAVCRTLRAGITEYELVGELSRCLWTHNLEPITLLIGFDKRARQFRHPVPVGAALKNYALIAVCARRWGLVASLTRLVSLSRDEAMMERQRTAAYVDAVLCSHTAAGANLAAVFDKGLEAYAVQGWEGEWKYHHQGGLTGYNARELKARHSLRHIIRPGEAYAWNPSVQGAKSENTIVVLEKGYKNLTHTGAYRYLEFEVNGENVLTENILILDEE
jgi:Xaa-Pro aminopeptidase